MRFMPLAIATVACAPAIAGAVTFSFASDSDADSPTWLQSGNIITDYNDDVFIDLLIDIDEDGPNDAVLFEEARFDAVFELDFVQSVPLPGGQFLHIWEAMGSFDFFDATGALILSAEFEAGAFSGIGSETRLGTAASVVADDGDAGLVTYTPGQPLIDLGINEFFDPQDLAFTFTDINDGDGAAVNGGVIAPFDAEGSYSGSAVIPTPGASVILASGLLVVAPRRRR
jgi:hypothetical protein